MTDKSTFFAKLENSISDNGSLLIKDSKKNLYFYQKVPKSILTLNLSPEALKLCGFMTYRFYSDKSLKSWLPLNREIMRLIIGGDYYIYLKELIDNGVWEVFTHESGAKFSVKKNLCKCYRYQQPYRNEMYNKIIVKTRCSTQKVYYDKKSKKELVNTNIEYTQDNNPIINSLLLMYKDITLIDSWQMDLWGIEEVIEANSDKKKERNLLSDKAFAVQIGTGSLSISTKNTGRLFHPAILMRRELRPYLRYKGEKLVTIDVKAAHPNFLGKFASEEDQSRWVTDCNSGNIYNRFVTDEYDRELIKQQFQLAISYSPEGKGKLAMEIIDYIESEYPSIYSWLSAQWMNCEINGKALHTPQFILQSLEAKIFINKTFNKFCDKFFLLPQHDGFLVESENAKTLISHLNKVAIKELGFKLVITIK